MIILLSIHPQYINDANGEKTLVVLPVKEFERIMEELEDMEDVRLYEEAKREDTGERIPAAEVFKMIEEKRKKIS
jgi:PHD/YefM family antitoxin component YafN of YafNO toxin-antitoxin module